VRALLDVTVEDLAGGQWQGQLVDVSPFGLKVRSTAKVEPGRTVRLSFSPSPGEVRITVLSLVVRKDPDGLAFAFVSLTNDDFDRLRRFVDARLPRPA